MEGTQSNQVRSRVIGTELAQWKDFQFIQQGDFKELPSEAKAKLMVSVLANNFTQPFYAWKDDQDGLIYCLDGKHRTIILLELIEQGYQVPDLLPTTFIHCENKQEAAKLVLIYSSIYAKITQQGLFDFIEMYELQYSQLSEEVNIPEMDWGKFIGDQARDFSTQNDELLIDDFLTDMTLKLTFSKEDYLGVKSKINDLMIANNYTKPEQVILNILEIEPTV